MDVYLGKSVTTSLPITHAQEISPTPLTRRPTPTKRTSDRPSGGRKSAALELREKQMQDFVDYFNPHVPGGYQAEKRSKGIGRLKQFIPKEVALTIAKGAFIVGMAATGVGAFEELSDYRPLSAKLDQQAMQSCNPVSQERMNAALAMVSSFKESTPSLVDKFEINVIRDVVNSPQVVAADNTLLDQLNFESCKRALYDQSGANTKQVIDLSLVLGGSLLATVGAFGTVLAGTSGEYRRFI